MHRQMALDFSSISENLSYRSLLQELLSAKLRKPSFSSSHGSNSLISHSPSSSFSSRSALSISVPNPTGLLNGVDGSAGGNDKSAASLEKEIMRLQDVLKERENEIALLEGSLGVGESGAHGFTNSVPTIRTNGSAIVSPVVRIESGESEEFVTPTEDRPDYEDTNGRSTPISSSPIPPADLSPRMMKQFKAIRRRLDLSGTIGFDSEDPASSLGQDNLLEKLNELMW